MKALNKKTIFNIAIMLLAYAAVFALINSGILSRQYKSLIVPICVNIMLAVSLNLVTGFLGELSLGHAGFMSIGAYISALISINTGFFASGIIIFNSFDLWRYYGGGIRIFNRCAGA